MSKHAADHAIENSQPTKKPRVIKPLDDDDDFDYAAEADAFYKKYVDTEPGSDVKKEPEKTSASASSATAVAPPSAVASNNFARVSADNMVSDPEQERALAAMKAGKSIFLTGPAGVGKSTVFTRFDKEHVIPNKLVFHKTAMTGVAAERIGGMTLHKYLGIGIVDQPIDFYINKATKELEEFQRLVRKMKEAQEEVHRLKAFANFTGVGAASTDQKPVEEPLGDKVVKLKSQFAPARVAQFGTAFLTKEQKLENELKANPYYRAHMEFLDAKRLVEKHPVYRVRHADGLMVDEISLMLNHVAIVMKNVIEILRHGKKPMQYIFGGDLFQGSPVNPTPDDNAPAYRIAYWELNQKFILDTSVWKELGVETFELSTVHRQSDPEQIRLLMCVRAGYMPDKYLKMLTDRSASGTEIEKGYVPLPTLPNGDPAIWLMGNRKIVSLKNEEALQKLPGDPFVNNTEIFYVFVERDAHRNPSKYWYRRIWSGGNYNFEYVNDFKSSSSSTASSPGSVAAAPARATCNVTLPSASRHRMVRILNQKLANSMSETVMKLKPGSNLLFTRSIQAEVVVNNGTQATVVSQTGMESKHKYEDSAYNQAKETDYIRMHEAPLPVPKISMVVNCKGKQIDVVPMDLEVAVEEGDEFRDPTEWTRYCVIRQFPVIPSAAITADRSISLEVDAEVIDCATLDSRESNGLFYIGLSRGKDLKKVLLKDFKSSVIRANPRAIIHGRNSIPFFRNMSDAEFAAVMQAGQRTGWDGTVSFYYEPDRHARSNGKA